MTAFDIYSAVGNVGEDILEESEIMNKKKSTKIIPLIAAAACFAVVAVGLSQVLRTDNIEQPVTDTTESTAETSVCETTPAVAADTETSTDITTEPPVEGETTYAPTEIPAPFFTAPDTGGTQNEGFYQPCNHLLDDIPVELLRLRDDDEVEKWAEKDKFSSRTTMPSSIEDYVNVYSFIKHFNITREEAETALEYHLNTPEEFVHITYEHLDIIYSDDVALITKTFASEYSIVVGDRIYSPEWLYWHSTEDYKTAGITPEDVLARAALYRDFFFTDEARQAFSEKLSEYTGEQVVIETVVYEDKPDPVADIEDEEPEPLYDDFEDIEDEVVEVEVYP